MAVCHLEEAKTALSVSIISDHMSNFLCQLNLSIFSFLTTLDHITEPEKTSDKLAESMSPKRK